MIDKEQVRHIAKLARLAVSDAEIETFTIQLGSILEYAGQLDAADTSGVEPMAFVSVQSDPLRNDEMLPSLPREHLLKNGPSIKKGCFAVPKVITR